MHFYAAMEQDTFNVERRQKIVKHDWIIQKKFIFFSFPTSQTFRSWYNSAPSDVRWLSWASEEIP